MSEFVLHPHAITDLEEIWEHIAADSLDAADRFREEIYETIQSLVPFPFVGYSRPDLTSRPLRFQIVHEYFIAYARRKTACGDHDPSRTSQSARNSSDPPHTNLSHGKGPGRVPEVVEGHSFSGAARAAIKCGL